MNNQGSRISFNIALYGDRIDARLSTWEKSQFLKRLWNKDHTLWSPRPVPELTDRLGWLTLPEKMTVELDKILQFADEVKSDGISQVVLLGMGGSSLAPEFFAKSFGSAPGYPELIVLDSTHPDAVISVKDHLHLDKTFFIVSSKSGTTLETISLFRFFWKEISERRDDPGQRFAAITDPGSPLMRLAVERNFRTVFEAPIDVGGRFSALSVFGLVPAALIGVDIRCLLERAMRAVDNCAVGVSEVDSTALVLGAMLGELADDRNKVTFLASSSIVSFTDWVEQLMAESTGKEGRGILPVVKEPRIPVDSYGHDRMFVGLFLEENHDSALDGFFNDVKAAGNPAVRIDLGDLYDLGQEIFRWEVAIAAACSFMGLNPFNQPDVQLSKNYTRRAMNNAAGGGEALKEADSGLPSTVSTANREQLALELEKWMCLAQQGDYLALQAFLAPFPDVENALNGIRLALLERTYLATTLGYGPRYLHSTGQLHKGGPDCGLFLELVSESKNRVDVPETDYTFNAIIQAQGAGDYLALTERKRRILRVELDKDVLGCLEEIRELIS
jgi:transaldolase/glucose-6-phosphate isomerase